MPNIRNLFLLLALVSTSAYTGETIDTGGDEEKDFQEMEAQRKATIDKYLEKIPELPREKLIEHAKAHVSGMYERNRDARAVARYNKKREEGLVPELQSRLEEMEKREKELHRVLSAIKEQHKNSLSSKEKMWGKRVKNLRDALYAEQEKNKALLKKIEAREVENKKP